MHYLKPIITALCLSVVLCVNAATGIMLNTATGVDVNANYTDIVYTITTTGGDPHITSYALDKDTHPADIKLQFQYQSTADIDDVQLFFLAPDESEAKSMHVSNLIRKTDQWTTATVVIANQKSNFNWGKAGNKLRIDFGNRAGITIKMRHLGINGSYDVSASDKNIAAVSIAKYLGTNYPSNVTNVSVTDTKIIISGNSSVNTRLVDCRMYGDVTPMRECPVVANVNAGNFSVTVDRYITVDGCTYDRLFSKWALIDNGGGLMSHARYADDVHSIRRAQPGILKNKKGLGGLFNVNVSDLDKLGLSCVTINLFFNEFMSMTPSSDGIPYQYCGRTYYINPERQRYYDSIIKACYENGVVVCGILLIAPTGGDQLYASTMCHPEYAGGYYSMPDITDVEGIHAYAATIDYLANRYSQPENGRIHHWVMHNEVDQHRSWTNMGKDQPMLRYLDHYEKSMRLVSNIVRQYDPNAYVLGSFTSAWNGTNGDGGFSPRQMLEQMVAYSNAEGDFRWGIADHPYPRDFFKPRFWAEEPTSTYSENTDFCTFKNMEVISNWVLRREHYYKNEEKRMLFFTENGVNARDNSAANLTIQAAGAAWAWKKTVANSGIDGIMWHNWFDHPAEAANGLALGLRDSNLNPKPSWYVWQAAGTEKEAQVLDQYLPTLGVSSWAQIHQNVSLAGTDAMRIELDTKTASDCTCQYNGTTQIYSITANTDDPKIMTSATTQQLSLGSNVLAFEYQADKDMDLQIFFGNNAYEERSITTHLKSTGSQWKRIYLNIAAIRHITGDWGNVGSKMRIDPGAHWSASNPINFKMRHLCIGNGQTASAVALTANTESPLQCSIANDAQRGEYTIVTAGTDPGFYSAKLPANLASQATKLIFEYQAPKDIPNYTVYFMDYASEYRSVYPGTLKATNTWKQAVVDISPVLNNSGWGFHGDFFRFDPGSASGVTFKIRNMHINDGSFTSEHVLSLDNKDVNQASLSHDNNPDASTSSLAYNSWTINTIGGDPYVITNPLTSNLNDDATKLHITYKSDADVPFVELFFIDPVTQTRSKKFYNVMPATSEWKHIVLDIADMRQQFGWGYAGDKLRIDPGDKVGQSIHVKDIVINNNANMSDADEIHVAEETLTAYAVQNGIVVSTDTPRIVTIYNLMGVQVVSVSVDTQVFIPLHKGFYILNGRKLIVR